MELANNPGDGTGSVSEDTRDAFKALLDSENATIQDAEADAEAETEGVSETSEDEFEGNEEQSAEDSNDLEDELDDAEAEQETAVEAIELADDALINVNGEQLTGRELKDRGLRWADYTRKMQELGEHRKKWIVQEVEFHQIRAQSEQAINDLAAHVAQVFEMTDFGPEPDWESEFATDPYEANLKRIRWDKDKAAWQQKQSAREQAVKAIHDAQVELARQNAAHLEAKRRHEIIESRELLAKRLPDVFGDPKKADLRLLEMSSFLQEQGYGPDEILTVTDARTIALAHYAMLGMEAAKKVKAAVQKIESTPAIIKPSTTASKKSTKTGFDRKLSELRNGHVDGKDMFKYLLDNE